MLCHRGSLIYFKELLRPQRFSIKCLGNWKHIFQIILVSEGKKKTATFITEWQWNVGLPTSNFAIWQNSCQKEIYSFIYIN